MHVQIIGMGVVGGAQAKLMQKLGHQVTGCDVHPGNLDGIPIVDKPVHDAELTFICTPEKYVPSVISNLRSTRVHNPYVIKSTVPTGTTQAAMLEHGVHICHNPEFLREETSVEDTLNQKFVVIGECCEKHGKELAELYKPLGAKIVRTKPNVSEMAKLILNNYLATLITFWNEMDRVCSVMNIDTKEVADIVKHDTRVSEYGTAFFGKPFGGKCLPKDLNQTLTLCRSKGISPRLLETVKEINAEVQIINSFRP